MSYLLESLTRKEDVDKLILDTIDKVLVLRIGRASDVVCMQLDEILAKSVRDVSKFASIGLIDADAPEIQTYIKYFDISLIPATIFFFNAHHMKMDSGTPDHTKWIGAFHTKQDFIDVVEVCWAWYILAQFVGSLKLADIRLDLKLCMGMGLDD
ncbi:hypothetical protein M758_11G004100 [Ceratodon purpureus]|nr:hypothetical protein M758_11G004100 [Ceratodon purpureus]